MNPQVYEVELSRTDYAVGLSALMGELARLDGARRRVLFGRLAVGVFTLIVIAYAFPISFPGLVALCLLTGVGDWLVQAAFRSETVGVSFEPEAHSNLRIEFGEEGIAEQGGLRTRRWSWDAVRRLHLAPDHLIIELKGWDMIVLPKRLWPTVEERDSFVEALEARRLSGGTRTTRPSADEAVARVTLPEPVLIARISLALAAFQLVFDPLVRSGAPGRDATFAALAAALLAGAVVWWASGRIFEQIASRSARAALRTAWGLFLLLAAAFALWLLR